MPSAAFERIALLGLGQMGTSLGLAFARAGLEAQRCGYDISATHASTALEMGAIDTVCATPAEAVHGADLIIFCTPMRCYEQMMQEIAPRLSAGAIITDIGSAKSAATSAITPHLPKDVWLVPAHPIAGSEKTGPSHARPGFFDDRLFILTPEEDAADSDATRQVATLWQAVGARVEIMPPAVHDVIYAAMSHLPQLIAYGCQSVLLRHGARPKPSDELYARFIRIGRSDPQMWRDVFLANAAPVLASSRTAAEVLSHIRDELILGSGKAADTNAPDAATLHRLHTSIWPRMVASALIMNAQLTEQPLGRPLRRYAVGGFLDTTAPASASPDADFELVSAHAGLMVMMLTELLAEVETVHALIASEDAEGLMEKLRQCQQCGIELVATAH